MSVEKTLQERGARYGDFTDHARIAQCLQTTMRSAGTNWEELTPVARQALTVIADKIARILSPGGDPNYADNWHDIQGYAKLVEDRLPKIDTGCTALNQITPAQRYEHVLNYSIQATDAEHKLIQEYIESIGVEKR